MRAHLPGRGPHRPIARIVGVGLGRLAAALAVLAGVALASATAIPAASAGIVVPGPGGQYGSAGVTPPPGAGVRVITAGGTPGWQIALIAAGAAVVAAAAAVCLDRTLTAGRPARRPGAALSNRAASAQHTSLPAGRPRIRHARHRGVRTATSRDNRSACLRTATAEPRWRRARQDAQAQVTAPQTVSYSPRKLRSPRPRHAPTACRRQVLGTRGPCGARAGALPRGPCMAGTRLAVPLDRVRATSLTWRHLRGRLTISSARIPGWRSAYYKATPEFTE